MVNIRKSIGSAYDSAKHDLFNSSTKLIFSSLSQAILNGGRLYDVLRTPEIPM
jgi:hypothetical protein